jgi:hypothetical protein
MRKYLTAPVALALLAFSLSGCVWYHRGYDHGPGYGGPGPGYNHPGGPAPGGYYNHPGY